MQEGGLLQMLVLEMHKCLDLSNSSLSFITLLLLDNLLQLKFGGRNSRQPKSLCSRFTTLHTAMIVLLLNAGGGGGNAGLQLGVGNSLAAAD
jgi:hypothetical protein